MKTRTVGSKLLACILAGSIGVAQLSAASVALAQGPAGTAPTDPKVIEARGHFNAGYAKYSAQDYAGALTEFQAADALVPAGITAQYIGLCQEKLGDTKDALAAFDRFEAAPGDKPQIIAAAAALKPHVAQLRAQLTQKQQAPFAAGVRKFNAGDYPGALTSFQAADAIMSTPQTYKYLGQTNDHLGNFNDAIDAYQKFLANVPASMAKDGTDIQARVATLTAMPGKVHVDSSPEGATVFVDGQPQPAPTPADLQVPPGHHHLEYRLPGYQSSQTDIDVGFASQQQVPTQTLAPQAPTGPVTPPPVVAVVGTTPPPPIDAGPPPPPQHASLVPAYVTGGLAIVAAGIGTVFGIMAISDHSDYVKAPTSSLADTGENHALISDMSFFVAITLGVTSAVLLFTPNDALTPPPKSASLAPPKKAPASFSFSATPVVTPHGGGLGTLIRF